mgnify:CR=1 FL=1
MKVFLRERKQTSKGKISLYLEIYKGTAKTDDGKVKPVREYEYLNLYLIEKPNNSVDRQQNKDTKKLAESIKAKREIEIKEGRYGFNADFKAKANFVEYFKYQTQRKTTRGNQINWHSTVKHLEAYAGKQIQFKDIDSNFCDGFKDYLETATGKTGKPLGSNTKNNYFSKFKAVLNKAIKDRIIYVNPSDAVSNFSKEESQREYLTIDEVKTLAKAPCKYPVLKNAFLFSCITGLRFSDVQKLQWSDVMQNADGWRLHYRQKKTKEQQYLDINEQSKILMGTPGEPTQKVFTNLKYNDYFTTQLGEWVKAAGIQKQITYHCSRHTFAVMQLTLGTDIYTVSKLLGHTELKTTQIYAKIVDDKKKEAVNRLPDFSF